MAFDDEFEIRHLRPVSPEDPGYEAAMKWIKAVFYGFHNPGRKDERAVESMARAMVDAADLIGVYRKDEQSGFDADWPVATFENFRKDLNVGAGQMVTAELISAVTVRSDHRRRGILSAMMRHDLSAAKASGLAVAALTVSEGAIYRRFGFGVATQERTITVDSAQGLVMAIEPEGTVRNVPRQLLFDLAPRIFAEAHRRQPGSFDRTESYRYLASGQLGPEGDDPEVISAVHYSADGAPDGYVSYKHAGWDEKPHRLDIVDLVAANDAAYLALWQFLGSVDLSTRIVWTEAPLDDPLPWALVDPRLVETSKLRDVVWLRILDVRKAFEARAFAVDGQLVFEVTDDLGFAAGRFQLVVRDGRGAISEISSDSQLLTKPDLSLDIAELSSIYLGGVLPTTLVSAGRIVEHHSGAVLRAQRMLAPERAVRSMAHF